MDCDKRTRSTGYHASSKAARPFTYAEKSIAVHPDAIKRQLAHAERNEVRAAYNRADYLLERKKMMQEWADYLDGVLLSPDKVVQGIFEKDRKTK